MRDFPALQDLTITTDVLKMASLPGNVRADYYRVL